MKTRTLARPVVLLLSYGYMHDFFQQNPDVVAAPPAVDVQDFGKPEVFVPQKVKALKRFKSLALAGAVGGAACLLYLLSLLFR